MARSTCWCSGGTEGILAGNPDIADVITMPERPAAGESLGAPAPAVAPLRPRALDPERRPADTVCLGGGPPERRVRRRQGLSARIKWLVLDYPVAIAGGLHRVHDVLRLGRSDRRSAGARGRRTGAARCGRHRAGSSLCGDPCGADVPLQALDRRRLAGSRGRARRARTGGDRNRRCRTTGALSR